MFDEMDDRQKLLGGVTFLLILVHMIFPKAGIDENTVGLMGVLIAVLYGREITRGLRIAFRMALDAPERRAARQAGASDSDPEAGPNPPACDHPSNCAAEAELAERIRQVSYQAEHARVAAASEGLAQGSSMGDVALGIIERSGGQPRVALMLTLGTIEQRLHAAAGIGDTTAATGHLVETGRVPRQFADALEAWRRARNDVAQSTNGGTTDDALWALVDIGVSLAALIPNGGALTNATQERPS